MINNVRNKENIKPPIIATPIGIRLVEAAPKASAMGSTPKAVAMLVIRIGRRRMVAASTTASRTERIETCVQMQPIRVAQINRAIGREP